MDLETLQELQRLPLVQKEVITEMRIRDAIRQFGESRMYISISGGKDSQVMEHLIRNFEMKFYGKPVIPRVFVNTGLEYPEVRDVVDQIFDDLPDELCVELEPKMTFTEVITKYGYPVISKQVSRSIHDARYGSPKLKEKSLGDGRYSIPIKWRRLINSDIPISSECCQIMKKNPVERYEAETGRCCAVIGIMADEGGSRVDAYLRNGGCNAFDQAHPQSKCIGFWTQQDILEYIYARYENSEGLWRS